MSFQSITTLRLVLRRLVPVDAATVYRIHTDPVVARFQMWEPKSVAEVEAFIRRMDNLEPTTAKEWFQIGIVESASGELVGDFGVSGRADDPRQVEFGITLARSAQGRGLATEALRALLGYLFTQTETHRVHCSVDPRNLSSLQLLAKVGLRQEGHLRESLWLKGEWVDDVVFAVLRSEWLAAHPPKSAKPASA